MLSRSRTALRVVGTLSASICFPDSRTWALQTKETLFIATMQRLVVAAYTASLRQRSWSNRGGA